MELPDVARMLRWFEKDPSDNFVGETQLLGLSLPALQSVFGVEAENLMFDSWSVEDAHLEFLAKHVDVEIDLSKFDYFVEADASTPTDGLEKCRKNNKGCIAAERSGASKCTHG